MRRFDMSDDELNKSVEECTTEGEDLSNTARAISAQDSIVGLICSSKLTLAAQSKVREQVSLLLSLVVEQQLEIATLKGRLLEKASYAAVASTRPAHRSRSRAASRKRNKTPNRHKSQNRSASRRRKQHVLAVYPNKEKESQATKKAIQECINPTEINIGIKKVKHIRKGGILIETDKEEDIEALLKEFAEQDLLKREYKAEKPKKRLPQIICFNITEDIDRESLVEKLKTQNEVLKDAEHLKAVHSYKTKRGANWIIETDTITFDSISNLRKLIVGWQRVDFKENKRATQCFKCWRYGHIAKHCRGNECCANCGTEGHKSDKCNQDTNCKNCSFHNTKFGTKYQTNHKASDKTCTVHKKELDLVSSKINYG